MERTVLNPAQLQILDLMSHVKNNEMLDEIKDMLSRYFAQKAEDAIDQLWDNGQINNNVVDQWKNEHLRTPYDSSFRCS